MKSPNKLPNCLTRATRSFNGLHSRSKFLATNPFTIRQIFSILSIVAAGHAAAALSVTSFVVSPPVVTPPVVTPPVVTPTLVTPTAASYTDPTSTTTVVDPNLGMPVSVQQTYFITDTSLGASKSEMLNGIINGNGLSGSPTAANYTTITHTTPGFSGVNASAWVSVDPGSADGDFFADLDAAYSRTNRTNPLAGFLSLSLPSAVDLSAVVLWGYNFNATDNGANNVRSWDMSFFNFDGTLISNETISGPAGGMIGGAANTLNFASTVAGVTRVQMKPTDNYYGVGGTTGGDRIGIAEVRFLTAVPEPSSALLGIVALGGLTLRRRR